MNSRDVSEQLPTRRALSLAVVTETFPPEVNGVAVTLDRVVQGLVQQGHDLHVVRPRQGSDDRPGVHGGVDHVLVPGIPIPRYPELRMGMPSTRALCRRWTERRPHAVYVATQGPLGWSALRAARRLRLPVCSDFRTNFHAYSRHYGVAWLERPIVAYLRAFHNATALTMVPTEALKRELATFGFERLVAVGRGVDTARFDPAHRSHALRGSWGAGGDTPVALFVGRLASEKNLGALAAAFAAMRQARPDTRLVVVGDGPAWHELLGVVPGIHFAGTRRGDDLAVHYASADVFVFPSMTETFGNVTTEAMASGLAVAAYDHAAAGQLIRSGSNGLLAPMGDQETFVAHAVRLVRERDTAARMGALARATACEHGWDRIVAQVEATIVAAIAHTEAMHTYETAITALRRAA